jgi:CxxC motif-containing protein
MAAREKVICIGCPLGCRVTVLQDRKGNITAMKGAECKQGEKYVLKELQNPVRILTATVRTGDEDFPLLPVRTSRPVLKKAMKPIMRQTAMIEVKPPVRAGDVIVKNVSKSNADLIATSDWPGPASRPRSAQAGR